MGRSRMLAPAISLREVLSRLPAPPIRRPNGLVPEPLLVVRDQRFVGVHGGPTAGVGPAPHLRHTQPRGSAVSPRKALRRYRDSGVAVDLHIRLVQLQPLGGPRPSNMFDDFGSRKDPSVTEDGLIGRRQIALIPG